MKLFKMYLKNDDDEGVYAMSIVESPATETTFIKLKKNEKTKIKFSVTDEDKKIITGAALIPDQYIYRDETFYNNEECYVTMSEDTIRQVAYNYLTNNNNNNVTLEHEDITDQVTLIESWVIEDIENDKANFLGYKELPKGTWMLSYQVQSDDLWTKIKENEFNGFSIEGGFQLKLIDEEFNDDNVDNDIYMFIINKLSATNKLK